MGDSGPQKGYFVNERQWTIINKEKRWDQFLDGNGNQ